MPIGAYSKNQLIMIEIFKKYFKMYSNSPMSSQGLCEHLNHKGKNKINPGSMTIGYLLRRHDDFYYDERDGTYRLMSRRVDERRDNKEN